MVYKELIREKGVMSLNLSTAQSLIKNHENDPRLKRGHLFLTCQSSPSI